VDAEFTALSGHANVQYCYLSTLIEFMCQLERE